MMHAEDAGGRVFMPFDYSPSGATAAAEIPCSFALPATLRADSAMRAAG